MLFRTLALIAVSAGFCLAAPVPAGKPSHFPDWWFEREVIRLLPESSAKTSTLYPDDYLPADDYAVANIGQLKFIASQAAEEMGAVDGLVGGAGTHISQLVLGWGSGSDDYAVVNLGQLKAVATPFYDRLRGTGHLAGLLASGASYPWSGLGADDFAAANIGQLKRVFSFYIHTDADQDGLPDAWEIEWFSSSVSQGAGDDADSDGLSNREEFLLGADPTAAFTTSSTQTIGLIIHCP